MATSTESSNSIGDLGIEALTELALDLRWAWNHGADELWAALNPELWTLTHNPWVVLQTASAVRLRTFLARSDYRQRVERLLMQRRQYLNKAAWFQHAHPQSPLTRVAYFSMEFALSEALPIYSGGLGNVAGDQLKAASDLGVPVIGVGLLYQQGYFRQAIAADGSQEALYPYDDPDQMPITPVRDEGADGGPAMSGDRPLDSAPSPSRGRRYPTSGRSSTWGRFEPSPVCSANRIRAANAPP